MAYTPGFAGQSEIGISINVPGTPRVYGAGKMGGGSPLYGEGAPVNKKKKSKFWRRNKKSEFGVGSAIFGISEVVFYPTGSK